MERARRENPCPKSGVDIDRVLSLGFGGLSCIAQSLLKSRSGVYSHQVGGAPGPARGLGSALSKGTCFSFLLNCFPSWFHEQ